MMRPALILVVLLSCSAASAQTIIANLNQPFGLSIGPSGELWVEQYNNAAISVVTPGGALLHTLPVAANPTEPAFSGNLAIYSSEYGSAVYAINMLNYQTAYTISIPSPAVANVAIGPNGIGYVTSDPGTLTLFNPSTGAVMGSIATGVIPRGIAFSPDGSIIAVANKGSATLDLISAATLAIVHVAPVGSSPRDVVINGMYAYTANFSSNTVTKVDWSTGAVAATIPVGVNPRRLASSGSRIFVSNQGSNSISVINVNTSAVMRTINLPGEPRNIAVSADGARLFVASYGTSQVLAYDVARHAQRHGEVHRFASRSVIAVASCVMDGPRRSNRARTALVDVMFDIYVKEF